MLQLSARPGCTVIGGVSGSGKTTFALRYLVAGDFTCRFLFSEPKRDFRVKLQIPDCETIDDLECAVEDGFVVFHPATMFPGDWPGGLEWFSRWSYDIAEKLPGRKVLMVDEVWQYCSPQRMPLGLRRWINDGRSFGCETIFCSVEPNRLNEALTGGATEFVCFQLRGENALKRAEQMGLNQDEIRTLAAGSFVAVNRESWAELRGRLW